MRILAMTPASTAHCRCCSERLRSSLCSFCLALSSFQLLFLLLVHFGLDVAHGQAPCPVFVAPGTAALLDLLRAAFLHGGGGGGDVVVAEVVAAMVAVVAAAMAVMVAVVAVLLMRNEDDDMTP